MSAEEPKKEELPTVSRTPISVRRTLGRRMLAWSAKLARLTAYFAVVAVVLGFVAARVAYAHAKRLALDTGNELVRLTGAANLTGIYRLKINGEEIRITSASSDAAPTVVLDRFQKACEEHADGLADDFANLRAVASVNGAPKGAGYPGVGLLREGGDKGGIVVCFAIGQEQKPAEVYGRVAEFAKTGDLAKIGKARYVMVKPGQGGGAHVVALWTEGSLDVKKMFPDEGDAPGSDVAGVMRPPSARRVLTAYAEGAPYGIRAYESTAKADFVLAQYDQTMSKLGWTTYPNAVEAVPYARSYSKDGLDIMVTTKEDDGKTMVSIVEMGRDR